MANFSALKTAIQNAIKQNGNEEITGDVLQQILLSVVNTMGDGAINTIEQNLSNETSARGNADTQLKNAINAIKANIDNGYVYAGIATPSSTPVSGKVFYIATAAGTYTNFGGQVLTQGINILRYNGSAWTSQQLIGIDDAPTAGSNSLVKSGGVQNEIALGAVYDVSAKNPSSGPNNDGKWESLSALFSDANLNTLIPTAYRKGGMSIKFVQSSDNKYVQYRLMSDTFNTTPADWQGIDDEPTYNSQNLPKSGGVWKVTTKTKNDSGLPELYNGTVPNIGNQYCIKTALFPTLGKKHIRITINRPNAEGCHYAYGYGLSRDISDLNKRNYAYSDWSDNYYKLDVESGYANNVIDLSNYPDAVCMAITIAEYDSNGNQNVLRITDFENYTVKIDSTDDYNILQDPDSVVTPYSKHIVLSDGIAETLKSIMPFSLDYRIRNGSQGNSANTWVVTVYGGTTTCIPCTVGNKIKVTVNKALPEGFYYYYRIVTYSKTNPSSLNADKVRDLTSQTKSIDELFEIGDGEKSFSVQLTALKSSTSTQSEGDCIPLRASDFSEGDIIIEEGDFFLDSLRTDYPELLDELSDNVYSTDNLRYENVVIGSCIQYYSYKSGAPYDRTIKNPLLCVNRELIPVTGGHTITYNSGNTIPADIQVYMILLDSSLAYIGNRYQQGTVSRSIALPDNAAFIRFNMVADSLDSASIYDNTSDTVLWKPERLTTKGKVENIEKVVEDKTTIVGRNSDKVPMLINSCRFGKYSLDSKDIMFTIITDMHKERKANQNAIDATNGISFIDAYVNAGDIVGSSFNEPSIIEAFTSDFNKLTKPGYIVIGNHDVGNCYYVGYAATHQQAYNAFIKPMVDKGFLANGEYEAGKPYWFHDITEYNIRLIGLYEYDDNLDLNETYWKAVEYDSNAAAVRYSTAYAVGDKVNAGNYTEYSFECVQAVTTPANYYTTPEKLPSYKVQRGVRVIRQIQAQWFLDTLASTPANYGVIVITHNPFSDTAISLDKKFSWPSNVSGSSWTQTNMSTNFIKNAIAAFMAGSSYSEKIIMNGNAAYLNTLNDGVIDYAYQVSKDFSAKNDGVHLLGLIGGHSHRDLIWKDGDIYQIAPNCAKVDGANDRGGDVRRNNVDSLSYDSLTIASFAESRIGLVKLGVNVTERGTFRDYEVIDTTT